MTQKLKITLKKKYDWFSKGTNSDGKRTRAKKN